MEQNYIWLSVSLFCSKTQWNIALNAGIKPIVTDLLANKRIQAYQLEFNYIDGENIRLALLLKEEEAEEVGKHADLYFHNFFLNFNAQKKDAQVFRKEYSEINLLPEYAFPQVKSLTEFNKYHFQQELSVLIIEAFEDTIDDETILTVAFSFYISLLITITKNQPELTEDLYNTLLNINVESANYEDPTFEPNKYILFDIVNDIIKESSDIESNSWINRWIKLCKKEIDNKKACYSRNELDETDFFRIIYLIHKHLGLTKEMELLLFHYVKYTLSTKLLGEIVE